MRLSIRPQRAVPDVSAYDDDIVIVLNGADSSLSGTSAACPIVAGTPTTSAGC